MGAGGALEHVMQTLDNESFYSKASAGKCVQAFGPLPRAEHHVRLERTSPCQDGGGESPAPAREAGAGPQTRSAGNRRDGRAERKGGKKAGARSWRAKEGRGMVPVSGSGVLARGD